MEGQRRRQTNVSTCTSSTIRKIKTMWRRVPTQCMSSCKANCMQDRTLSDIKGARFAHSWGRHRHQQCCVLPPNHNNLLHDNRTKHALALNKISEHPWQGDWLTSTATVSRGSNFGRMLTRHILCMGQTSLVNGHGDLQDSLKVIKHKEIAKMTKRRNYLAWAQNCLAWSGCKSSTGICVPGGQLFYEQANSEP